MIRCRRIFSFARCRSRHASLTRYPRRTGVAAPGSRPDLSRNRQAVSRSSLGQSCQRCKLVGPGKLGPGMPLQDIGGYLAGNFALGTGFGSCVRPLPSAPGVSVMPGVSPVLPVLPGVSPILPVIRKAPNGPTVPVLIGAGGNGAGGIDGKIQAEFTLLGIARLARPEHGAIGLRFVICRVICWLIDGIIGRIISRIISRIGRAIAVAVDINARGASISNCAERT